MGLTSSRGKAAFAVACFDDGDQVVFDEVARGVAHQPLVVGKQRIKLDEVHALELKNGHILLFGGAVCIPGSEEQNTRAKPAPGQTFQASRANGQGQTAARQFEYPPALKSISCATAVKERFSLMTMKSSSRARVQDGIQCRDASHVLPLQCTQFAGFDAFLHRSDAGGKPANHHVGG